MLSLLLIVFIDLDLARPEGHCLRLGELLHRCLLLDVSVYVLALVKVEVKLWVSQGFRGNVLGSGGSLLLELCHAGFLVG